MADAVADDADRPRKRKVFDGGFLVLVAFTAAAAAGVAWKSGVGRVVEIVAETMLFLLALLPKISAGVFIAAAIPLLMPRERIAGLVGGQSGLRGLILAAGAGALIPGGPMMIFPISAGFMAAGADVGALVAFVTGWNLLGLNRTLIWELSFLHADFVGLRYGLSAAFPVLCGLAARRFFAERSP